MEETLSQQVVFYVVHALMLAYYLPKVWKSLPAWATLSGLWSLTVDLLTLRVGRKPATPLQTQLAVDLRYLLDREKMPIVFACLAINALGLTLSRAFPTLVYLDMTGTAVAAFLLGPWHAASVAALSSAAVNCTLFPGVSVVPWTVVNVTGAIFWGLTSSAVWFRTRSPHLEPNAAHISVIAVCGVLAAFVLAIPGTITQEALGDRYQDTLSFNPAVAESMKIATDRFECWLNANIPALKEADYGFTNHSLALYVSNALRYIPDKVLTVLAALMCIRMMFPIYWDRLVRLRPHGLRVFAVPRQPLLFLVVYLSVLALHHLLTFHPNPNGQRNHIQAVSLMWLSPLFLAVIFVFVGSFGAKVSEEESRAVCARAQTYRTLDVQTETLAEELFDNKGTVAVLGFVLFFALLLSGLVAVIKGSSNAMRQVGVAFSGMSSISLAVVFMLKFMKYAVIQHSQLPLLANAAQNAQSWANQLSAVPTTPTPPTPPGHGPADGQIDAAI